jgi:hypothetical protein
MRKEEVRRVEEEKTSQVERERGLVLDSVC